MDDEFTFNSAGQIHELEMAFAKSGDWTNSDMTCVIQKPELLSGFLKVVREQAQIVVVKYVVTCARRLFLRRLDSGWDEEEYWNCGTMELEKRADGQLYVSGRKVERYLHPDQKDSGVIYSHKLRKELSGHPILCTCVLDYLLEHTELIPEDWRSDYTFFWGTIFRDPNDRLYVACLYWNGRRWNWHCNWLGDSWYCDYSAACLARLPSGR